MSIAVKKLYEERLKIAAAKRAAIEQFNKDISEINNAIKIISGKSALPLHEEPIYDDENPDYIKGSIED